MTSILLCVYIRCSMFNLFLYKGRKQKLKTVSILQYMTQADRNWSYKSCMCCVKKGGWYLRWVLTRICLSDEVQMASEYLAGYCQAGESYRTDCTRTVLIKGKKTNMAAQHFASALRQPMTLWALYGPLSNNLIDSLFISRPQDLKE